MSRPTNLNEVSLRFAIANCRSAGECARFLNVHYNTFKKYAQSFVDFETGKTLFELSKETYQTKLPEKKRRSKSLIRQRDTVERIITNQTKNYLGLRLMDDLIYYGLLEECCHNCQYSERRIIDYKMPLILDFIDGDEKNGSLDNLRFLCYNCYFQIVGNLSIYRKTVEISDDGEYS